MFVHFFYEEKTNQKTHHLRILRLSYAPATLQKRKLTRYRSLKQAYLQTVCRCLLRDGSQFVGWINGSDFEFRSFTFAKIIQLEGLRHSQTGMISLRSGNPATTLSPRLPILYNPYWKLDARTGILTFIMSQGSPVYLFLFLIFH